MGQEFFAAHDGLLIWGVGETPEAALGQVEKDKAWRQSNFEPDLVALCDENTPETFSISRVSESLAAAIKVKGAVPFVVLGDGSLDIDPNFADRLA
jgi:hypothetical protein